jgi:hypothetical protein
MSEESFTSEASFMPLPLHCPPFFIRFNFFLFHVTVIYTVSV